eukprot:TRINITY_DN874_c0_g1_i12.p1 TRINITY_DN874_c0_g1~~TRINITY_DN874_c0_g1_i12.p1  ORF type:complete len:370 (+),score=66.36 TRINITY_DN874_c0_g1_i12:42-1151(+)
MEKHSNEVDPPSSTPLHNSDTMKRTNEKFTKLLSQLQEVTSNLDTKFSNVLIVNKQEIIDNYKSTVAAIDAVLNEYRRRIGDFNLNANSVSLANSLRSEVEYYKKECGKQARVSAELRAEILKLKSESRSLRDEMAFYERRLKIEKQKNRIIPISLNKSCDSNATVKETVHKNIDFNDKFGSFIDILLDMKELDKKSSLEKCREYYRSFADRTSNVIRSLKLQMEKEKKIAQRFRGTQTFSQAAKGELELLFLDCVEGAKKRLAAKKKPKKIEDIAISLSDSDKASILEEFIGNEKVIQALASIAFKPNCKAIFTGPERDLFEFFKQKYSPSAISSIASTTNAFPSIKKKRFLRSNKHSIGHSLADSIY